MPPDEKGSVTRWVGMLVANGDEEAARQIWNRYFERLVGLARAKLKRMQRPGVHEHAEDAALSALKNFCLAARDGRFPLLKNRDDLWWLLVKITVRKAHDVAERETRKKRPGGFGPSDDSPIEQVPSPEPTPEDVAIMVEQFQRLLDLLGDETLRQVALWRLEGYTNDEIAGRLGCARRTVANRLEVIRKHWSAEAES
jgi:DNA-directed RNA polymerase specialized sigma24 family protein